MGAGATQPRKRLGAWLARVTDTVYQTATDGFVICFSAVSPATELEILTDGSNPPTTKRGSSIAEGMGSVNFCFCCCRKNDYWKTVNALTVFWIPLEP